MLIEGLNKKVRIGNVLRLPETDFVTVDKVLIINLLLVFYLVQ